MQEFVDDVFPPLSAALIVVIALDTRNFHARQFIKTFLVENAGMTAYGFHMIVVEMAVAHRNRIRFQPLGQFVTDSLIGIRNDRRPRTLG